MNKNKKPLILMLGIIFVILLGGVLIYRGFALEKDRSVSAHGVEVSYPADWKSSPYQFYMTAASAQPGAIVSSSNQKINIAIAPEYFGDLELEHPESFELEAEVMLVNSAPLKDLPGVSAVQLVMHYYDATGTSHYVAKDILMTDERLQLLGLRPDKMVEVNAAELIAIKPPGSQAGVMVGFNSQESLTSLGHAVDWFKAPEVQAAHSILLSAKPSM